MAIYRGPGGAGDATNDATSQAILAAASAVAAANSEAAAATSATSAANSATAASSSASAAASSEASVATNASNAATSATNAASSATAAANSASAASTSETNAASSASAAATSATNAANSATSAANSATTATTQATNASNSATAAATSATNAANSATAAATSETNAASSASTASTSATNAASSATSASVSASTATTQATNAASSATAAATSATNAATSETNAASSASVASTSATNAANSASASASSATASASSAISAAGSATAAASSAVDAQSSEDAAAAYAASINPANLLAKASNLSDLPDKALARDNLGVEIGADVQAYSPTLSSYANGATLGFKNRIINGAMRIDQRNSGASVTPTNGQYLVDRFRAVTSQPSKFTTQQNAGAVAPPAGFTNYLGITSSSAYSVTSSDYFAISCRVEGYNVADLDFGTTSAKPLTVSFWVRSSIAGQFGGAITNTSFNRFYPVSYTINSANTWEYKTVSLTADTTGTWDKTNGIGLELWLTFGAGSSFTGTAGSWSSTQAITSTGSTNLISTSGATFYITGVQLEKGSTATSFDYRPYGTELALCQRYYEKSFDIGTAPANGVYTQAYLANVPYGDAWVLNTPYIPFKVEKRAIPTLVYYGSSGWWQVNNTSNNWDTYSGYVGAGVQGGSGVNTKGMSVGVHNNGNSGYAVSSSRSIRGDWTASAEL